MQEYVPRLRIHTYISVTLNTNAEVCTRQTVKQDIDIKRNNPDMGTYLRTQHTSERKQHAWTVSGAWRVKVYVYFPPRLFPKCLCSLLVLSVVGKGWEVGR